MSKYQGIGRQFKTYALGASALAGQAADSVGCYQVGGKEVLNDEIRTFVDELRKALFKVLIQPETSSACKTFLWMTACRLKTQPIFTCFDSKSVNFFYEKMLEAVVDNFGDELAILLK